jgi:hypothetical protein
MALSNIDKVRIQTGDRVEPFFVSNDEIGSFLEENNDNVRKAALQVANAILFQLATNPSVYRERTGEEEVFTSDPYKNYKEALLLLIKYPHKFLNGIMPYAAGLTKSDKAIYTGNLNNSVAGENLPSNSNTTRSFINTATTFTSSPLIIIEE